MCDDIAPGRGAELAERWRARQLELSWLRTAMQVWVDFDQVTADALDNVLREMDVAAEPAAVARTAGAFRDLPVHPEVPGVLEALRDGGLQTGILTNASAATLDAVLRRTGLAVDHALSVDAARRFKPHPAVYELGTKATGLPADRIGFVTGNAWDAAGAGTFGFRVAWLRAPGRRARPSAGRCTGADRGDLGGRSEGSSSAADPGEHLWPTGRPSTPARIECKVADPRASRRIPATLPRIRTDIPRGQDDRTHRGAVRHGGDMDAVAWRRGRLSIVLLAVAAIAVGGVHQQWRYRFKRARGK